MYEIRYFLELLRADRRTGRVNFKCKGSKMQFRVSVLCRKSACLNYENVVHLSVPVDIISFLAPYTIRYDNKASCYPSYMVQLILSINVYCYHIILGILNETFTFTR